MIELSHTPHEVAIGRVKARVLEPDLRVGFEDEIWFGAVADVASLGDGRCAVFDRMERQIVVFDARGRREAIYGRRGGGPGEYLYPWALASMGKMLVAWQRTPSSTFTVLDPHGAVFATGSADIPGDWAEPTFRFPLLNLEGFQHGPEDVTRRLAGFGDSTFVILRQINEKEHVDWRAPADFSAPPAYLIRYGADARVQDTLAELAGPPTLLWEQLRAQGQSLVIYERPLFSPRPVWTTGDGWIALSHGGSSQAVVRRPDGDTLAIVRWPRRRPAVSERDKIEAARWLVALRIINSTESRELWQRASRRERKRGIEFEAFEVQPSADSVPTITAAYGVRSCLFIAGHNPRDWPDGTALTWLVLDVQGGRLEGVLRVPAPAVTKPLELGRVGAAVREFDARYVYVYSRDGDGVFFVERYRLPPLSCSGN